MIHYPKLIQIILNFTEIEALPKYIRNKSSEIQNLFSAEIPALLCIGSPAGDGISILKSGSSPCLPLPLSNSTSFSKASTGIKSLNRPYTSHSLLKVEVIQKLLMTVFIVSCLVWLFDLDTALKPWSVPLPLCPPSKW